MRARLRAAGWILRDGCEVTASLAAYRSYIRRSQGQFSIAKPAYVATRSGWFSGRSACYLAAGRPVIVQDTGLGEWLDTGLGVLAFDDGEGAISAIERVARELSAQSQAARSVAHDVFHYGAVLERLLDRATGRSLGAAV